MSLRRPAVRRHVRRYRAGVDWRICKMKNHMLEIAVVLSAASTIICMMLIAAWIAS